MYLCLCKGLTEDDVRHAARAGCTTGSALIERLGLDDEICCGRCVLDIEPFVTVARREVAGRALPAPLVAAPLRLSPAGA